MQRRATWLVLIVIGEALKALSPRAVRRLKALRRGDELPLGRAGAPLDHVEERGLSLPALGLSFFMVNVWVHLCWLYTQVPRRGDAGVIERVFGCGVIRSSSCRHWSERLCTGDHRASASVIIKSRSHTGSL